MDNPRRFDFDKLNNNILEVLKEYNIQQAQTQHNSPEIVRSKPEAELLADTPKEERQIETESTQSADKGALDKSNKGDTLNRTTNSQSNGYYNKLLFGNIAVTRLLEP